MENQFIRTQILLGQEAREKLGRSKVAVFGVGGVGGYVAEALARCGVGAFELIDRDQVSVSNLNRQIIATWSTVGMDKTEAMARRIHDINPDAQVVVISLFNGTQGLGALPGTNISIGNALDPIFNGMNARIVSCNAVHNYYRYIDITKVEHPAWPDVVTMLSGDFYGYMMLCTHPTRNGHKWIANKVLKAI